MVRATGRHCGCRRPATRGGGSDAISSNAARPNSGVPVDDGCIVIGRSERVLYLFFLLSAACALPYGSVKYRRVLDEQNGQPNGIVSFRVPPAGSHSFAAPGGVDGTRRTAVSDTFTLAPYTRYACEYGSVIPPWCPDYWVWPRPWFRGTTDLSSLPPQTRRICNMQCTGDRPGCTRGKRETP